MYSVGDEKKITVLHITYYKDRPKQRRMRYRMSRLFRKFNDGLKVAVNGMLEKQTLKRLLSRTFTPPIA